MNLRARIVAVVLCATFAAATLISGSARAAGVPPIRHVFTIVLENSELVENFGAGQVLAPYLARTLPSQGALIPNYFGTGHSSLDNYIAMTSGQGPNPKTQGDCDDPTVLGGAAGVRFDTDGQAIGSTGCTYPASVHSVADQLDVAGLTWKGYMQDMDSEPARFRTTCRGPSTGSNILNEPDPNGSPKSPDDYKDKHNPFPYYHSISDNLASCDAHDVPLGNLSTDLQSVDTTPNYVFITPNQCADGHDNPCADGSTGGLPAMDAFLKRYVPMIESSPAFLQDGMLLIIFDEGVSPAACCGEKQGPNTPNNAGASYPSVPVAAGGGQTGAIAISPRFIKPDTITATPYNHYSYLRSIEDLFGLSHLGYAAQDGLTPFGSDVYTGYQ